jgi:Ca2+:H+ antiporter
MINVHGQGLTEFDPHDRQKLQDFLSRSASVILLTLYGLYQVFRSRTHRHLFDMEDENEGNPLRERTIRKTGSGVATALLLCTIWATYVCALPILKTLTTETEPSRGDAAPLDIPSQKFFSFFLLPLLAELAEISRTCSLACNSEMQLAYTVAATTSIHMMLLVAPLFCLSAWCMGISLDLDLGGFEVVILGLNIYLSAIVTGNGSSNYLDGSCIYGL